MHKPLRQDLIMQQLSAKHRVYVSKLAAQLNVSEATVRKDLDVLEESGLLKRVHGGAVPMNHNSTPREMDFMARAQFQQIEKEAIAQTALDLIQDHDSILLDASSTCYQLASLLRHTTFQLTVVTNGIRTAALLSENEKIRVFVVGGLVRSGNAIGGLIGSGLFAKVHINKAFVSARGIDIQHGLTDFNLEEVELKNYMIEQVGQIVALVDHTKIGVVSVAGFCPLSRVSIIITDTLSPIETLQIMQKKGITVRQADTKVLMEGYPERQKELDDKMTT